MSDAMRTYSFHEVSVLSPSLRKVFHAVVGWIVDSAIVIPTLVWEVDVYNYVVVIVHPNIVSNFLDRQNFS